MQDFLQQIYQLIATYVPNLLGAVIILVVGWIAALIISAVVKGVIKRTSLGEKLSKLLSGDEESSIPIDKYVSKSVFYIIMLFVLIAFFQALGLTIITEPLNNLLNELFAFAPNFFGAAILVVTAWALATILRFLVTRVLTSLKLDERISDKSEEEEEKNVNLTSTVANAIYWLVFLLFLPAILSSLQMDGLLEPVQSMLDKILSFIPNLVTAGVILLIGFFVAKIIRNIVSNLLAAVGLNNLGDKIGLNSVLGKDSKLSDLIGMIVYVLILVPIIITSLEALGLEAVTVPISNMLSLMLETIPLIFTAAIIIIVSYVIGKLVAKLVSGLLAGMGFDKLIVNLGIMQETEEEGKRASDLVGTLIMVGIIFIAVIEAFEVLGFQLLSEIAAEFTLFAGNIIVGLIIFGLGLFLSNLIANKILTKETTQLKFLSLIARIAILFIVGSMALQHMGVGEEIINLAFGLILGAIAIAVAVAFGIGGRDIAASKLQQWIKKLED